MEPLTRNGDGNHELSLGSNSFESAEISIRDLIG